MKVLIYIVLTQMCLMLPTVLSEMFKVYCSMFKNSVWCETVKLKCSVNLDETQLFYFNLSWVIVVVSKLWYATVISVAISKLQNDFLVHLWVFNRSLTDFCRADNYAFNYHWWVLWGWNVARFCLLKNSLHCFDAAIISDANTFLSDIYV